MNPKSEILDSPGAKRLFEALNSAENVVLTTHEGPDGDGIGSEVALCTALRTLGKKVRIINPGPTLSRFQILDPNADIVLYNPQKKRHLLNADLVLLIDTAELRRAGVCGTVLCERTGPIFTFDHHTESPESIDGVHGDSYSSTGELIIDVLDLLGATIDKTIATSLYGSILYDTHQFRFTRNDPEVFVAASRLVRAGASADAVGRLLFGIHRRDGLMLNSRVLNSARFEKGGRLAIGAVSNETTAGLTVDRDEIRDTVSFLGDIEGVEIAIVFKNFGEETVKISIRSRGAIKINQVAMSLGGGGHPFAAGADVTGTMTDVMDRVVPMLLELLA